MAGWQLEPDYAHLAVDFGSLEAVFALQGERITRDIVSELVRVERDGVSYYVKRYRQGGKGLRRYLGRPRIKAEWQNLKRFEKWGIPTAHVLAWGLERRLGLFDRGAMVTRELPQTRDLAIMAYERDSLLSDTSWVRRISQQVAEITRRMHDHHFVHNDLKWRNLLVDQAGQVFLIDCPSGAFWWGPLLRYRIDKDLACLDKVASKVLTRSQRLRFYLQYRGRERLSAGDKRRVRRILKFFEGRE